MDNEEREKVVIDTTLAFSLKSLAVEITEKIQYKIDAINASLRGYIHTIEFGISRTNKKEDKQNMENIRKYTFLKVLEKAIGTDRRIRKTTQVEDYFYTWCREDGTLINKHGAVLDWPTLKEQKAEIWEIEEEPIYVWGACDNNGHSFYFNCQPERDRSGIWQSDTGLLLEDNLFSKDKPQKYKLVPVEDE